MKRFKLNKYTAGPGTKQAMGTILSGNASDLMLSALPLTTNSLYIAGWSGVISDGATITADTYLYAAELFGRRYSEENPDIVTDGVGLDMLPTDSPIQDIIQFGNYAFSLTDETISGTSYALETTPDDDNWLTEPHQIVTYVSGEPGVIDKVIGNVNSGLIETSTAYGFWNGTEFELYVQTIDGPVYSYDADEEDKKSLPFAYLMEQPLNTSVHFQSLKAAYGISGDAEMIMYTPQPGSGLDKWTPDSRINAFYSNEPLDPDDVNKIYFNPFKLKNMYNYNWNSEYNVDTEYLTAIRNYNKVGKSQQSIWLSYKYIREVGTIVQEFDLVERIKGLYKYRPKANHKSNIYSIEIADSGLNDAMEDGAIKTKLRELVEHSIHKAVKKIAPASTQLWKIEYTGR